MIPKILHQIYFREGQPAAPLPDALARQVERIKAVNPDWEHRLYNLAAMRRWIAAHHEPSMLARFDSLATGYGAAKADLFRYLVMQRDGGVYLDIKIDLTATLDTLVGDGRYLLTQWDNAPGERHEGWGMHPPIADVTGGEYIQWVIVAPPNSAQLSAVVDAVCRNIDHYDPAIEGVGRDAVLAVTGPIAYTRALHPLVDDGSFRFVRPYGALGLIFPDGDQAQRRRSMFGRSYLTNWRPLVRRPGFVGMAQLAKASLAHGWRQARRIANVPTRTRRMWVATLKS